MRASAQRALWNTVCSTAGTPVELIHKRFVVSPLSLVAAVALIVAAAAVIAYAIETRTVTLRGAVIRQSDDPMRRDPVAGALIVATDGSLVVKTKTDSNGAFAVTVRHSVLSRRPLTLDFTHGQYRPFHLFDPRGDRLYVIAMQPLPLPPPPPDQPTVRIGDVSVRYTLKTETVVDVGSGVKTFQVVNRGDVPCHGHPPCSPDGKWKAAIGAVSLDAGPQNEFRDGRVSCIAGPCPFTKIQRDNFSQGGRVIGVSILNWSDTATFLLQAEAVRHVVSDATQRSYPVLFDRIMNFSLPASAEGTCIEADVDGMPIVFPIVPNLSLSWANCETQAEPRNNKLFRCELKPGYAFR